MNGKPATSVVDTLLNEVAGILSFRIIGTRGATDQFVLRFHGNARIFAPSESGAVELVEKINATLNRLITRRSSDAKARAQTALGKLTIDSTSWETDLSALRRALEEAHARETDWVQATGHIVRPASEGAALYGTSAVQADLERAMNAALQKITEPILVSAKERLELNLPK